MKRIIALSVVLVFVVLGIGVGCGVGQSGDLDLEGTWSMESYVKADSQVRYQTSGYMMFGKKHWLHVMFFNRDPRDQDFAEAHHGTYEVTGPDTISMVVEMELHMDPKKEFQETEVWYGPEASLDGAKYRVEGDKVTIDLPSTAQLVMTRVE